MLRSFLHSLAGCCAAAALTGCSLATGPLGLTVAGAGTSAAFTHSLNGAANRTFTATMTEVKEATIEALERMGIKLESMTPDDDKQIILASAERRNIEIELEPITPKTTRVKVVAKNGGLFYDASTAGEIVVQTEKNLLPEVTNSTAGASVRRNR
jgi:hypothetical protein